MQQYSSRLLILFCSSFCESEKIHKLSAKSSGLIFVSLNFNFSLFSLIGSAKNEGKSFINKLQNIVLNMSPSLSPIVGYNGSATLYLYNTEIFDALILRGLYLKIFHWCHSFLVPIPVRPYELNCTLSGSQKSGYVDICSLRLTFRLKRVKISDVLRSLQNPVCAGDKISCVLPLINRSIFVHLI